jgi:Domain of unknown function (DUF2828)
MRSPTFLSSILPRLGWIHPRRRLVKMSMHLAIQELFDPNFLDVLLPPRPAPATNNAAAPVPKNLFMDALKSVAHHKLTQNAAPAFSSTLSSTLDAFQSLSSQMAAERIDSVLAEAWEEDPALTLKIIWNTRSIHDGKGDKELFYRCVQTRVRYQFCLTHHPCTHLGLSAGFMSITLARRLPTSPNSLLLSARSSLSALSCHTAIGRTFSTSSLSLPSSNLASILLRSCTSPGVVTAAIAQSVPVR